MGKEFPNWDIYNKLPVYSFIILNNLDIAVKLKYHLYHIDCPFYERIDEPFDIADFRTYEKMSYRDKTDFCYEFEDENRLLGNNQFLPKHNKKLPIYFVKVRELTEKRSYKYYYKLACMGEELQWELLTPYITFGPTLYYIKPNQEVLFWHRTSMKFNEIGR